MTYSMRRPASGFTRRISDCRTLSRPLIRRRGKKNIDPNSLPGDGKDRVICPHAGGAKSWIPGSFNPETKILYVPPVESCMDLNPVPDGGRGSLSTGVRWSLRPRPDSDGRYGRVQAINMLTREVVWTSRHRTPESSGALDGGAQAITSRPLVPEIQNTDRAATIWVFEAP